MLFNFPWTSHAYIYIYPVDIIVCSHKACVHGASPAATPARCFKLRYALLTPCQLKDPASENVAEMFRDWLHPLGVRPWVMQVSALCFLHRFDPPMLHALTVACPGSIMAATAPPPVARPATGRASPPPARASPPPAQQPPTPIDFNRDLPTCPDVTLSCASSSNDICITLQAVDKPQRVPTHCIIVMDVSGSMDSRATQPDASDGEGGSVVFTRLDLAKHSSKVIVEVMSDTDSVTIISFGSTALVELGKTHMTAAGKQQAHGVIERLCTAGSTNLIAANDLALQQAALDTHSTNIHIVLLTDGEPDDVGNVLPKLRFTARSLENERISGVVRAECWRTLEGVVDHGDVRLRHWAVRVVRAEITWHLAASH